MIYEPREDSYFLLQFAKEYAQRYKGGIFLDMGSGSGIIGLNIKDFSYKIVLADINDEVIESLKKTTKHLPNIEVTQTNLFKNIKGKFDLIIFNPPYLPRSEIISEEESAICGGKKGNEIIIRFLKEVKAHIKKCGTILIIFSSLSKKKEIEKTIKRMGYKGKKLGEKSLFFEKLFVYEIKIRQNILLKEKEFLAKGKRGIVYIAKIGNKKVIIKEKNPESKINTLSNEAIFLEELNQHNIGAKVLLCKEDKLVMEYIEGKKLPQFLEESEKKEITEVLKDILEQCFIMDNLHINKFELTRPYKHIIVRGNRAIQIDFERCRRVKKVKNVTQFCQFLISKRTNSVLERKGIKIEKKKIIKLMKNYKKNYNRKDFEKILDILK